MQALTRLGGAPYIRIVFAGGAPAIIATLAGVPGIEFCPANENVSRFIVAEQPVFSIPEVHEAIAALRSRILTPIGHYVRRSKGDQWPFQHFPAVVNRKGDQIAAYAVNASPERSLLLYIVVPQLDNNASGLVKILDAIRKWNPAVFPEFGEQAWYDSEEFLLPEERAIQRQITAKLAEAKEFVGTKRQEQARARNKLGFIKRTLVATEDPQLPPEDHLSTNIKKTLEFLGFSVEDIDAKIKGAIRKEDFWVVHGDFLAITEVTGTTNKNPKSKEYNDILGRMNTIFKRSDLVPDANRARVSGLLVINHDLQTHPDRRPRLYSGELEHICDSAKESGIGILATTDLYRICIDVEEGVLSREEARQLLKLTGRIEYKRKTS